MEPDQAPKRPGGEMKGTQSAQPSKSQLLPFTTNAMELTTKPYFLPGLVAAILVPLLFSYVGGRSTIPITYRGIAVAIPTFTVLMALLLTAAGAFVVVRMVGKPKAWWTVPAIVAVSAAFLNTALFYLPKQIFSSGFGDVQPGDGLLPAFFNAFIAIGFPEELYKAIPVALGVLIGKKLLTRTTANNPLRQFAVMEPLDGILIGAAAGLGFAFNETLLEYVPKVIVMAPNVAQMLLTFLIEKKIHISDELTEAITTLLAKKRSLVPLIPYMYREAAGAVGPDTMAFLVGQVTRSNQGVGLELLIPRLLGNVLGHSAYAGIFGYFIGLAAMKPQNWIKTVLIGLGIAAGLHGLWDAVAMTGNGETVWYILISFVSFAGMCTLIMKAREISPNRSQLVASQIIDRMAAGLSRSQLVPQGFGASVAPAAPTRPVAPPSSRSSPVPAYSITYDDGPDTMIIEIGAARVPVALGTRLYERQAPGTRASRGDSVIGEINANPKEPDVLGIKNLSEQIWHVTTQDGERRELVPGRSVRLLRGMRVLIGDLHAEIR